MAWDTIAARVRREFTLDVDSESELVLTLSRPNGRMQRVMVRHYRAWEEDFAEVRSAFGEASQFDPATLLTDSLQLPLGSIALHGRYAVLVHKVALQHMSEEGFLYVLSRLAVLADVLEERSGGDRF
jgi:hypothetical protein